jgi:sugar phosphate isomerase/epimerase
VEILKACGYTGVLSLECEGMGGPMIERSLSWVRRMLVEVEDACATKGGVQ